LPPYTRDKEREGEQEMVIRAEKNQGGAWTLSGFIGEGAGEYLFTRSYYFYTKGEAIRLFKEDIKREEARA
jgi:hypothetical protein